MPKNFIFPKKRTVICPTCPEEKKIRSLLSNTNYESNSNEYKFYQRQLELVLQHKVIFNQKKAFDKLKNNQV